MSIEAKIFFKNIIQSIAYNLYNITNGNQEIHTFIIHRMGIASYLGKKNSINGNIDIDTLNKTPMLLKEHYNIDCTVDMLKRAFLLYHRLDCVLKKYHAEYMKDNPDVHFDDFMDILTGHIKKN